MQVHLCEIDCLLVEKKFIIFVILKFGSFYKKTQKQSKGSSAVRRGELVLIRFSANA